MKRTLTLFACVAVCSAMMVSCKNAKTVEPTPEEIQAQKVALADSILTKIDAIAEQVFDAGSKSFRIKSMELTENEKMVKPDYLLDLSVASQLVTKSQKINALGIYIIDYSVRTIYNMPLDEAKEVIIKLATEVSGSFDVDAYMNESSLSGKLRNVYEKCKENGELAFFWQYCCATLIESGYVLANNPELFFNKITEEQWQNFEVVFINDVMAVMELAKYDDEMAEAIKYITQTTIFSSKEDIMVVNKTKESAKQYRVANKDKFIAKRNALLQ